MLGHAPVMESRGPSVHEHDQYQAGLAHTEQLLHEEFDEQVGPERVDARISEVVQTFADATVLAYIPLLVRRLVREQILPSLPLAGPTAPPSEAQFSARRG